MLLDDGCSGDNLLLIIAEVFKIVGKDTFTLQSPNIKRNTGVHDMESFVYGDMLVP